MERVIILKWQNYPAYEALVVPFVCDGDVAAVAEFENWSIDFGNMRKQITIGEMVERYNRDHRMLVRDSEGYLVVRV